MMWDQVIRRLSDIVQSDTILTDIYGDNMRMAGVSEHVVPSLEWTLIADAETELWAPCTIQFDQWCLTMDALVRSERRLRALFHTSLPAEFDGLRMDCQYLDGQTLATPDRNDVDGRAVRFRFTPLRSKYVLASINLTP